MLLRSFDTELAIRRMLRNVAATLMAEFPGAKIDINVTEQYRNMLEVPDEGPAGGEVWPNWPCETPGLTPKFQSIRGGTDGSKLSEKGCRRRTCRSGCTISIRRWSSRVWSRWRTPVKVLVELAQLWGKEK